MEQTSLKFNNLQNALNIFINDFIDTYKQLLIRDGKKASGNLINSLKPMSITYSNNKMNATISIADYWKYVEYGRRPGKFPPVSKILNWIRIKPVLPRPINGAKPPTEPQLAFLISRKIARDGIQPGNQFSEALRLSWTKDEKLISDAITADLNEAINLVTLL